MTVSSIFASIWSTLTSAYSGAGKAARKTKIRTELKMIDREIAIIQKAFGVTMFDHLNPLSQFSDFHATTDGMTEVVRPPFLTAQIDIQVLADKHATLKESLVTAVTKRAEAFPVKAETVGGKVSNIGKASVMHSGETKIKAELVIVKNKMKSLKQTFGLKLFEVLDEVDGTEGFSPKDGTMRNIYYETRGEVEILRSKRNTKKEDLVLLGGSKSKGVEPSSSHCINRITVMR